MTNAMESLGTTDAKPEEEEENEELTGLVVLQLKKKDQVCQRHIQQLFIRGEQVALVSVLPVWSWPSGVTNNTLYDTDCLTQQELYTSIMTAHQIFCILFLFWLRDLSSSFLAVTEVRAKLSLLLVGPKPDKSIMYIYRMITCPAAAQLGWQSLLFSPLTGRIPRPTNHRLTGGNNVDDTVPISMCQQTTQGAG